MKKEKIFAIKGIMILCLAFLSAGFFLIGFSNLITATASQKTEKILNTLPPLIAPSPQPELNQFSEYTNWRVLGIVVRHVNVTLPNGTNVQISMSQRDIRIATTRFNDMANTLNILANGQMNVDLTIIVIETPLTTVMPIQTTMGTIGYAPSSRMLHALVQNYVNPDDFDHVMFFLRTQLTGVPSVPTAWSGLYQGMIGNAHFSQVIFGPNANCTWHDNAVFPERILVHEFIHGLERHARIRGIEIPSSIDANRANYGYGTSQAEHLRFYRDYLNQNIQMPDGRLIGLTPPAFITNRASN